jgi:hypothetical protein
MDILWNPKYKRGLMSGLHSIAGKERFALDLQTEGRNSVEDG